MKIWDHLRGGIINKNSLVCGKNYDNAFFFLRIRMPHEKISLESLFELFDCICMAIRTGNLKEMDDSVCDRVQPSPKSKTQFDFESKQTKFYEIVNGKFDKFKL